MNPLARLSPALFTALSGLVYDSVDVPVYEHSPTAEDAYYILLINPKIVDTSGRASCRQWLCEIVIKVMTQFASDAVSGEPSDDLTEAILARLEGYRLPLPDRWDCLPGQLVSGDDEASDADQEQRVVLRRLRFQWLVTHHGEAKAPPTAPVIAAAPAPGFLAFFQRLFS